MSQVRRAIYRDTEDTIDPVRLSLESGQPLRTYSSSGHSQRGRTTFSRRHRRSRIERSNAALHRK